MALPNAAAGTTRRMKDIDDPNYGQDAPATPSLVSIAKGAVMKPVASMADENLSPPPGRGLGSAIKRMLGFGAKR